MKKYNRYSLIIHPLTRKTNLIFSILGCCLMSAITSQGQNLAKNPDLENGIDQWSGWFNGQIDASLLSQKKDVFFNSNGSSQMLAASNKPGGVPWSNGALCELITNIPAYHRIHVSFDGASFSSSNSEISVLRIWGGSSQGRATMNHMPKHFELDFDVWHLTPHFFFSLVDQGKNITQGGNFYIDNVHVKASPTLSLNPHFDLDADHWQISPNADVGALNMKRVSTQPHGGSGASLQIELTSSAVNNGDRSVTGIQMETKKINAGSQVKIGFAARTSNGSPYINIQIPNTNHHGARAHLNPSWKHYMLEFYCPIETDKFLFNLVSSAHDHSQSVAKGIFQIDDVIVTVVP